MEYQNALTSADYSQSALIIIDFQNDCVLPGSTFEIPGSFNVIPNLQQLVKTARTKKVPVIHVVRAYNKDGSNADLCRREMIQKGKAFLTPNTQGVDFPTELKPQNCPSLDWGLLMKGKFQQIGSSDWVMYKSRWGAFYHTDLQCFLMKRHVNTLIFAGCNFPNCPRTSIYEASERDFRIVIARDAISGLYGRGLQELKEIGVNIASVDEICSYLK